MANDKSSGLGSSQLLKIVPLFWGIFLGNFGRIIRFLTVPDDS